jgi:hypothetical protein
MASRDKLDPALAKHFAWCFAPPGGVVDVAERLRWAREEQAAYGEPALTAELLEPLELEDTPGRARSLCGDLSAAVADAWAEARLDASVAATKRILSRADRLGVDIAGMDAHPTEAVHMLRLMVRHGAKLTRRQRERAAAVAERVPLAPREVVDLLVEVAQAGDRTMAEALLSGDAAAEIIDDGLLVARLADVLDAATTHASRALTIDILRHAKSLQGATSALRRALGLPSFAVRARALHALSTSEPVAVTEGDVVAVLRDLVAHPPPDAFEVEEQEEDERLLAEALTIALEHVQPDEAEGALLDLIDAGHDTIWLDAAWATEALAVCFPATAAVMVDHWLKCARAHERTRALAALRRLPPELAEPRLRLAAGDPVFSVRDAARAQWLERFGRTCPISVADLPGASLLDQPASERFMARLAVMHGRVPDARVAMARALLAEPPDRESLVLLLQLVGDDFDSEEPRLGLDNEGWAVTLATHFGALGVQGLCALAARFPEPESFGWMRRLGDLIERGVILSEDAACVRGLAAAHVASEDAGRVDDAMRVLARLGAPPELVDRVLALAFDDDFGAPEARALVVAWPDRAIDARLASEMALSLAEQDWVRLRYASAVALERGAPGGRVIARRVLEVAEHEPEAADAAVECARQLRIAGDLGDGWAAAALSHPEGLIFAVAARAWRGAASIRPALQAALASRARGGASAVQAAIALLQAEPGLSPRDRRLVTILESSNPANRAELVYAMCARGAPLASLAHHLEELLISPDPNVAGALVGVSAWLTSAKARALLRAIAPRIVDFELRADVEETVGAVPAPYWAES